MKKKNELIKSINPIVVKLSDLGIAYPDESQEPRQEDKYLSVGFFRIPIPDWTKDDVASGVNLSANYYERLDFELVTWDSIVHCVCPDKTLEQLLKEIYDKYSELILSWIIKKSIRQIQIKLQEMGIKKYLDKNIEEKTIAEKLTGEIKQCSDEFIITIHQTENREIEKWFVENNNFQQWNPNSVRVQLFDIFDTVRMYIQENDFESPLKLMVSFCNLFRIPYKIDIAEQSMVDFDCHFILDLKQIEQFVDYTINKKILKQDDGEKFKNQLLQLGDKN